MLTFHQCSTVSQFQCSHSLLLSFSFSFFLLLLLRPAPKLWGFCPSGALSHSALEFPNDCASCALLPLFIGLSPPQTGDNNKNNAVITVNSWHCLGAFYRLGTGLIAVYRISFNLHIKMRLSSPTLQLMKMKARKVKDIIKGRTARAWWGRSRMSSDSQTYII